jgi:hypothetical protein
MRRKLLGVGTTPSKGQTQEHLITKLFIPLANKGPPYTTILTFFLKSGFFGKVTLLVKPLSKSRKTLFLEKQFSPYTAKFYI